MDVGVHCPLPRSEEHDPQQQTGCDRLPVSLRRALLRRRVWGCATAMLVSGDIAKIGEDHRTEAVLRTPHGPIEGRDGIGELFAGALAAGTQTLSARQGVRL